MIRALVFFILFVIFLIIKVFILGGKKLVEIGVDSFDSIYGSDYGSILKLYLNEPNIEEAIVGILTIVAFEHRNTDSGEVEKNIIYEAIHELANVGAFTESTEMAQKHKLFNIVKGIRTIHDNFLLSGKDSCFYQEIENIVDKYLSVIHLQTKDSRIRKNIMKQLIYTATADNSNKACKRNLIFLLANKLSIEEEELKKMILEIEPSFLPEEHKYAEKAKRDPYKILGVDPHDSFNTVRKKYRELMIKFHPEAIAMRGLDDEFIRFANERLKEINWAYEKIKDEKLYK